MSIWLGWALLGFVAISIELSVISGFGVIFFGLGCLTLAVQLHHIGDIDLQMQTIYLLLYTAIWFILLWKPLKAFISSNNKINPNGMIGVQVVVEESSIAPNNDGRVKWSGAIMNARNVSSSLVQKGDVMTVKEVEGNILICTIT